MATTASGVTIPGSSPTTTPATPIQDHWNNLGKSLNGRLVIPVASVTDRAARVAALVAEGYVFSASNPLYSHRADAPAGFELEYTINGTTWRSMESASTKLDATNAVLPTIRQWGIGKIPGNGTTQISAPFGFPVAFVGVPHVTTNVLGYKATSAFDPTGLTTTTIDTWTSRSPAPTSTTGILQVTSAAAAIAAGFDIYVSWEAVGRAY